MLLFILLAVGRLLRQMTMLRVGWVGPVDLSRASSKLKVALGRWHSLREAGIARVRGTNNVDRGVFGFVVLTAGVRFVVAVCQGASIGGMGHSRPMGSSAAVQILLLGD